MSSRNFIEGTAAVAVALIWSLLIAIDGRPSPYTATDFLTSSGYASATSFRNTADFSYAGFGSGWITPLAPANSVETAKPGMAMSLHLWKSDSSLPENTFVSRAKPPPTMANVFEQAVVIAASTLMAWPSRSTGSIGMPATPPWSLHHFENATDASHSSLLRPCWTSLVRSLATPM